jgi:hypothetical protein
MTRIPSDDGHFIDDDHSVDHGHDTFATLAVLDAQDQQIRPLADVARRATQLRRGRRARAAALSTALVVAAGVGVSFLPGSGGVSAGIPAGSGTVPPTTGTTNGPTAGTPTAGPVESGTLTPAGESSSYGPSVAPECLEAQPFSIRDAPSLLHVIAPAPGAVDAVGGTLLLAQCDTEESPVAGIRAQLTADGSRLRRAVAVTGPATRDQVAPSTADAGPLEEPVVVQGNPGRLVTPPASTKAHTAGTFWLTWQEASSGRWWLMESAGMSRVESLAMADGLRFDAGTLDTASLPGDAEGWTDLAGVWRGAAAQSPETGHRVELVYQLAGVGHPVLNLSVADIGQPYGADRAPAQLTAGAVRFVDVHGVRAVYLPAGWNGDSPSLWWSAGGEYFTLYGSPGMTVDEFAGWARSVRRVPADDPRLRVTVTR